MDDVEQDPTGSSGMTGKSAWSTALLATAMYVVAAAVALGLSSLLVMVADGSPAEVWTAMWDGAFGSRQAIASTLVAAAPFGIVAIGAVVANRAGLFNIGQEGQLTVGAALAIWAGIGFPGAGPVKILAALVAGFVGGALWASVASVAKYRFSVNEAIATLLLNFIAFQVVVYALDREFLLKPEFEAALPPQSGTLSPDARLPSIASFTSIPANSGILLMLFLVVVVAFVFARTAWGRKVDLLGRSPLLARRAGVRPALTGSVTLAIAGGTAGLAGAVILTGSVFRVDPGFSNNVGWTGLLVALVARDRPIVVAPVALAFGGIKAGGNLLAATGVPRSIADVVQALVVLATVIPPVVLELRARRFATAAAVKAERVATASAPPLLREPA